MTNKEMIAKLNEIQKYMYDYHYLDQTQKGEWNLIMTSFRMQGLKIGKKRSWDGSVIWYLKRNYSPRRVVSVWEKFDPPCDHNNECTTRSLFFCLNESIPYNEIRNEQNQKARNTFGIGRCKGWNNRRVWETVLTDRGFSKLLLPRHIRAYQLAKILSVVDTRILCHSPHHCLSVFNGRVYDSWDSSMKVCDYIMVRKEFVEDVLKLLNG